MKHIIELKEDIVIPAGTKFYPCSKTIAYDCYVGDVSLGMLDDVISVIVTDDGLKELGDKFGSLIDPVRGKNEKE